MNNKAGVNQKKFHNRNNSLMERKPEFDLRNFKQYEEYDGLKDKHLQNYYKSNYKRSCLIKTNKITEQGYVVDQKVKQIFASVNYNDISKNLEKFDKGQIDLRYLQLNEVKFIKLPIIPQKRAKNDVFGLPQLYFEKSNIINAFYKKLNTQISPFKSFSKSFQKKKDLSKSIKPISKETLVQIFNKFNPNKKNMQFSNFKKHQYDEEEELIVGDNLQKSENSFVQNDQEQEYDYNDDNEQYNYENDKFEGDLQFTDQTEQYIQKQNDEQKHENDQESTQCAQQNQIQENNSQMNYYSEQFQKRQQSQQSQRSQNEEYEEDFQSQRLQKTEESQVEIKSVNEEYIDDTINYSQNKQLDQFSQDGKLEDINQNLKTKQKSLVDTYLYEVLYQSVSPQKK